MQGVLSTGQRGLNDAEKKVKLHMLVVANTNDPTVGKAAVVDMNNAIKTFDTIARFMGIQMQPVMKIYGKIYNKESVQKAIAALQPGENDIVVFYSSGHGFRKATDSRPYPYIDLRPKDDKTYNVNSLNIKDVYDSIRLKPKGARLNIIISDCCNNIPGVIKVPGKSIVTERGLTEWSRDNCAKLFLDTAASLLITSAGVDETASCDDESGSFCTIFLRAAIANNLAKTNRQPSWTNILNETADATSYKARHICCNPEKPCTQSKACSQHPIRLYEPGRPRVGLRRLF